MSRLLQYWWKLSDHATYDGKRCYRVFGSLFVCFIRRSA